MLGVLKTGRTPLQTAVGGRDQLSCQVGVGSSESRIIHTLYFNQGLEDYRHSELFLVFLGHPIG